MNDNKHISNPKIHQKISEEYEMCGAVLTHAFNIHEVGVGTLHQPLLLVSYPLLCKTGVHQIPRQLQPRSDH